MEENQEKKTIGNIDSQSVTIQDLVNSIIELDKMVINILDKIKSDNLEQNVDSRILFLKSINDLNINSILQFSFLAESQNKLSDKDWLKKRLSHLEDSIEKHSDINKFAFNRNRHIFNQLIDNLILNYYFEFETKVRNIVRSKANVENPEYLKKKKKVNRYFNGSEPFGKISNGLFENHLKFNKEDYEVVWIFSAIRNTIHNSGFYFSQYLKDSNFNYRKVKYIFKHGKPVSFLTLEMKFNLMKDLLTLFDKIINHDEIKKMKQIKDPISEVTFEK